MLTKPEFSKHEDEIKMAHTGSAKFKLPLLGMGGRMLVRSETLFGHRRHKGPGRNCEHFREWRRKEQTGESRWCWGSGPGGHRLLLVPSGENLGCEGS